MRGLSAELQQLVDAGKTAGQPTMADSARVFGAIQERLGIPVVIAGGTTVALVTESSSRELIVRAVAQAAVWLALGAAGAAMVHLLPSRNEVRSDAIMAAPLASAVTSTDASAETATIQAQDSPRPSSIVSVTESQPTDGNASAIAASTSRSRDTLSDEVTILARAERELHRGGAQRALDVLGEHERKYKNGILAEERTAARIQALCALERVTEANALLGTLSPQSVHGGSSRQACAAGKSRLLAR